MKRLIPSKYLLFAFVSAFFFGCVLAAGGFTNIYIVMPVFVLLCLLIFINKRNKPILIIPILVAAMLFGIFGYYQAISKQSSLMPFAGKMVTIVGVAAEDPITTEYGLKVLIKNVYYIENNKTYKCSEKLQLYIGEGEKLQFGDQIKLLATVEPIAKLRNFGDFKFKEYYASKGIYMKAYPREITVLASGKGGFIPGLLHSCKLKVKNTIFAALSKTEAALLYGILTGSKSDIDPDVLQVFALTGLAHVLSVSGLHIGFLVLLLTYLLKPLNLNKQLHSSVIFILVLFYIMLIGAPVPAVRALLMLAVMLGGTIIGKDYNLIASASCAALLLLVYNPLLIHDPSFIISFACIYSICFFHQPLNNAMGFMPSWVRSSLALSIAVWVGITPVLIYYFNYISLINIFLNVLAVPLVFLITLAGFVAVAVGILLPSAALFIFAASYYLIKLLYLISEKALLMPFTGISVPSLPWYIFLIYYFIPMMLIEDFWKYRSLNFKRKYIAAIILGICIVVLIYIIPGRTLELYYIDVGQGDCSVIKTPGHKTIIVDGGGSSDWEKNRYDIGEKITVPALLHIGVWKVDTVIVSHIHDDHLGGILPILESYKVKQVILPAADRYGEGEFTSENYMRLKAICKAKNIPLLYMQRNNSINAGDVKLKVLAPEKPYIRNSDSDVNNNSLVFMLSYKGFDALFTGDIQQETEQRLLDKDIQCDVLKIAHHGSPYSSIDSFVEHADPEISIITVGRNNYGHPSKQVIERLKMAGSLVYRTDLQGAVRLSTDGKRINIKTVR